MADPTPVVILSPAQPIPPKVRDGAPVAGHGRLLQAKQSRVACALLLTLILFSLVACAKGSSQLDGWKALRPGMELWSEPGRGPHGEPVIALLYVLVPATEYGIERQMPIPGLEGRPSLRLMAKTTRVLYVGVVLLDSQGHEHKSTTLLEPGEWRTLEFDTFEPAVADWSQITTLRFMDYTGLLIGQGSVSLKLAGLPQ
jgi:hypothetical protein